MSPDSGRCLNQAILSASVTRLLCIWSCMLQQSGDYTDQVQPPDTTSQYRFVACPNTVRRVRLKVSVEQIRRSRPIMLAAGDHDEFTLSARFDAMYLHEPPNPFLPNSHAISPKFSPDPRPAIFAFGFLYAQP